MEQKPILPTAHESQDNPESYLDELSTRLQDAPLQNKYLEQATTSVMQDYVKLGVAEFLGRMPKEEVDALYDQGENTFDAPLSPCVIYSEDGTEIVGYDVYKGLRDKVEQHPAEVEAIKEKSDDLYRKMSASVEGKKVATLETEVQNGRVTKLGEMTSKEFADYLEEHPGIYEKLISLFVYDQDGNLAPGRRLVFHLN
jgi:hypothetical protein